MKYLVTSDWHLGARPYGYKHREEDIYDAAFEIVNLAIKYNISVILNGGDILDVTRPSSRAIVTLSKIHELLIKNKITMYMVEGNHDRTDPHWIMSFQKDDNYGIKIINDNCITASDGETTILGIGESPKEKLLETLGKYKDKKIDIVLLHASFLEFVGYAGDKSILSAEDLKNINAGCFVIGDTHVSKAFEHCGKLFISPGALENLRISEDLKHYAYIVDTSIYPMDYTRIELATKYNKCQLNIECMEDVNEAVRFIIARNKESIDQLKCLKVFIKTVPDADIINAIQRSIIIGIGIPNKNQIFIILRVGTTRSKNISSKDSDIQQPNDEEILTIYQFSSEMIHGMKTLSDEMKTLLSDLFNNSLTDSEDRIERFLTHGIKS